MCNRLATAFIVYLNKPQGMDLYALLQRIRNLSDTDLIDLLLHREDYEPEVGEAAEGEFVRRNLPFEALVDAQETSLARVRERAERKSDLFTLESWYEQVIEWMKGRLFSGKK